MTIPTPAERALAAHVEQEVSDRLRVVDQRCASMIFRQPCPAPAPLVVNGSPFVGCQLDAGHDGQHEVRITWGDRG